MVRRAMLLAVGLAVPVLSWHAAVGAETLPPAVKWVPQSAVLCVELSKPEALLDVALAPKVTEAVTSQPAYQKLSGSPQFKGLVQVVEYLERTFQTDWQTGLRKFLAGGVTASIHPKGGVLVIVDAEDEKMLGQLHEIFRGFAEVEAAKQGKADRVQSKEYRGVNAWTFGPNECHAVVGKRLLLSNRKELLKAALDLRAGEGGASLAGVAEYQAARKAAGTDAAAAAFVNVKVLKQFPPIKAALEQDRNVGGSLLLGGAARALRDSTWLALGLHAEGNTLRLEATSDGRQADPSGPLSFAAPQKPGQGALPSLDVPQRIAAMSFYRDLHGFYAAKDELFPERTSGLIFFENMMGIFFTGRDLTEEVLGELGPEVRVVVTEQKYDPAVGTPQLQLPAFAMVFRLKNPDKFAVVVEEAWQKALGLVNFTRGQQAQPGLIIDRPVHGDTKFTMAYFAAPPEKDKKVADARFNFSPSLARQGQFMILSSTQGLARDLIDAVKKETAEQVKALAQQHTVLELNGVQLASILAANRENMIRQNMVEKGNTRQQAETEFDMLTTLARYLGQAKFEAGQQEGRAKLKLTVKLNLP